MTTWFHLWSEKYMEIFQSIRVEPAANSIFF